jgi:hypothetical protein
MAIGDMWRIAYVGTWNGQQIVNVFHFKMKSNADPVPTAANYLTTALYSLYKTACQNTCTWTLAQGRSLTVPSQSVDFNLGTPQTGTSSVTTQPMTHAIVVSLRTQFAGRRYRGRIYLPGFYATGIVSGQVTTTARNAIQVYFDDMVAAVGASGSNADLQWGVWSRVNGEVRAGNGQVIQYNNSGFTPITSTIVRVNLGSMRTRAIGKGS